MKILPFLYFPFFRLLFFVFFFGSLTCKGQESDGTPTAQAPDTKNQSTEQPKGTIQQIAMAEKPFVGYAFYDDEGKRVKLTNIRLFPTINPFNKSNIINTKKGYIRLIDGNENDTLNNNIEYDFKKMSLSEKSFFLKNYKDIPPHLIDSFDVIISTPNGTHLSGNKHQFLIVQSNANFVRSDTTVWSNTYISVYDYKGIVKNEFVLNGDALRTTISDDGQFLLSELVTRYYGDEEYYEFAGLLIRNLINKENKTLKPDINSQMFINDIRYNGKYFSVFINKDSPVGSMSLMLIDPSARKVFQKQILLNDFNEWSPLRLPDGSEIDLKIFKESNF